MKETIGQALIAKLSDPRVDPARTTVTRVEIAEDLLTAKVFVSVIGTEAERRTALRALQHASGRIQKEMTRRVQLRHTPLLKFVYDETYKKTLETLQIIQEVTDEIEQKDRLRTEQDDADGIEPEST
jgi:ribosome-binding factor A